MRLTKIKLANIKMKLTNIKMKLTNIKMKLTNMKIFRRLINRVNANTSKLKLQASTKMNQIKRRLRHKVKNFPQDVSQPKSDPTLVLKMKDKIIRLDKMLEYVLSGGLRGSRM